EFKLTGPGVNLSTSLNDGDASQDTLQATFQANSTYVAVDQVNPATRLSFGTSSTQVGAVGGATTSGGSNSGGTTTTAKSGPGSGDVIGNLVGSITAGGKVTLTYKGKTVGTIGPGKYAIAVIDKSKTVGLYIQQLSGATTIVS